MIRKSLTRVEGNLKLLSRPQFLTDWAHLFTRSSAYSVWHTQPEPTTSPRAFGALQTVPAVNYGGNAPAAVVIPAPIAYIKVVVVEKLVVGSQQTRVGLLCVILIRYCAFAGGSGVLLTECLWVPAGLLWRKLVAQGRLLCLKICAWNNRIGCWSYFVGFQDST